MLVIHSATVAIMNDESEKPTCTTSCLVFSSHSPNRLRPRLPFSIKKSSNHGDDDKPSKSVHFGSTSNDAVAVRVSVQEFSNPEFLSQDAKLRKQIWYSSLELRAIKQANMDISRMQQQLSVRAGRSTEFRVEGDDDNDSNDEEENEVCFRGLEHLVEGEANRLDRVGSFVCGLLKLQSDKQAKKSLIHTPVADALKSYSRNESRTDRHHARKQAKLDAQDAATILEEYQEMEEFAVRHSTNFMDNNSSKRSVTGGHHRHKSSNASCDFRASSVHFPKNLLSGAASRRLKHLRGTSGSGAEDRRQQYFNGPSMSFNENLRRGSGDSSGSMMDESVASVDRLDRRKSLRKRVTRKFAVLAHAAVARIGGRTSGSSNVHQQSMHSTGSSNTSDNDGEEDNFENNNNDDDDEIDNSDRIQRQPVNTCAVASIKSTYGY